jgi:preprotein translocase subunit SecE
VADKKTSLSKNTTPHISSSISHATPSHNAPGHKSAYERAKQQAAVMASDKAKQKKTGKKARGGISKYFHDMRSELKKVVWPSRQKTLNNTSVVMACMIVTGLIVWGIDSGLGALFKLLVK